jgi:hypothetical protein
MVTVVHLPCEFTNLCYNSPAVPYFTKDHVFILPQAEEYRKFYSVRVSDVLSCLNEPHHDGLATDHYVVEKTVKGSRLYVYYYLTLPLQGKKDEAYAIVDFIGLTDNLPTPKKHSLKQN